MSQIEIDTTNGAVEMLPPGPGVSDSQAERLLTGIKAELTAARTSYKKRVQEILLNSAILLARLSPPQLDRLINELESLATPNEIVKAVLYGRGMMARHLVTKAITPRTFNGLPASSKKILNDPEARILLKYRNKVISVKSSKLKDDDIHKLIDARRPERGIIPPDEQGEDKSFIPEYFEFVEWIPDAKMPSHVILTFQKRTAIFKSRISLDSLEKLAKEVRKKA